jgi:hypothetical protein
MSIHIKKKNFVSVSVYNATRIRIGNCFSYLFVVIINRSKKQQWNPKMLRMAALNEPFYGNLQGMRNADLNCHRQARRAGLMGTFRAFLSAR